MTFPRVAQASTDFLASGTVLRTLEVRAANAVSRPIQDPILGYVEKAISSKTRRMTVLLVLGAEEAAREAEEAELADPVKRKIKAEELELWRPRKVIYW